MPAGILDEYCLRIYNPDGELRGLHLYDTNSGNIERGICSLPDVPQAVLMKYPGILAGIQGLEEQGFPVLVKDASLGGAFPVMCVTLMNPRTGCVFASFGARPSL